MIYNALGNSGLIVSKFSLGTWLNFDSMNSSGSESTLFKNAFNEGVNFFDTADSYGDAEIVLGKALKKFPRKDVVVSTKVFFGSDFPNRSGLGKKHLIHSVEESLKRLNMEMLDLLYLHRFDNNTPLEETLLTINQLISQGKILYWGVSRWSKIQLEQAIEICDRFQYPKPIAYQDVYNLFNYTSGGDEFVGYLKKNGIGLVGYSPLARGVLTNKYKNTIPINSRAANDDYAKFMYDLTEEKIKSVQLLEPLSKKYKCTVAQLVTSYLYSKNIESLVFGFSYVSQFQEIIKSKDITLESESINEIKNIFKNYNYDKSL